MIIFQNTVFNYIINSIIYCLVLGSGKFEIIGFDTDTVMFKFINDIKLLEMKDGS